MPRSEKLQSLLRHRLCFGQSCAITAYVSITNSPASCRARRGRQSYSKTFAARLSLPPHLLPEVDTAHTQQGLEPVWLWFSGKEVASSASFFVFVCVVVFFFFGWVVGVFVVVLFLNIQPQRSKTKCICAFQQPKQEIRIFRFVLRKATDFHKLWKIRRLIGMACSTRCHCMAQVMPRLGLHMVWACGELQKRPALLGAHLSWSRAVCKKPERSLDQDRQRRNILAECFCAFSCCPVRLSVPAWGALAHLRLVSNSLGALSQSEISLGLGHCVSLQPLLHRQC